MNIALSGASSAIAQEIIPFLENHGFNVIQISTTIKSNGNTIFSYQDLKSCSIKTRVDIFIHLASFNSKLKQKNFNDEISLTHDVLNAMESMNCKKLIFFSTCKIYGEPEFSSSMISEDSDINPLCNYSKAKLACENLINARAMSNEIHSIIFRLPPLIKKSSNSYIGKLMSLSKTCIPIASFVEGEFNKRSFISINNLTKVIYKTISEPNLFMASNLYNLADNDSISINKLLRKHSQKKVHVLPLFFSKLLRFFPISRRLYIRLFGNFEVDNSKLLKDLKIKLHTTEQSLPIIFK